LQAGNRELQYKKNHLFQLAIPLLESKGKVRDTIKEYCLAIAHARLYLETPICDRSINQCEGLWQNVRTKKVLNKNKKKESIKPLDRTVSKSVPAER
jgi:hypothetical protein